MREEVAETIDHVDNAGSISFVQECRRANEAVAVAARPPVLETKTDGGVHVLEDHGVADHRLVQGAPIRRTRPVEHRVPDIIG